jgi:hypothetical protein
MTELDKFKNSYPTDTFLAEMRERRRYNRAWVSLGPRHSPNYVGVVCLSDVEFERLIELADTPAREVKT